MSYTKKVALNTAAQFIGKIIGIAIALVTIGIIFRLLGVEGAGKYTTVFAYTSFFSLFADIGLGWTLLRELSVKDSREEKSKVFKNIFTLRMILGIFVFAFASVFVRVFHYPLDVQAAVPILSITLLFQALTANVVQVYLNSYRMDIAVSAEVVGKVFILLGVYMTSRMGGGLMGVVLAYLIGSIINFAILWLVGYKFINMGLAFDKTYWNYALRQALPIGIVLVFGYIYYKVDSLMISLMKGMTDVGIYGAPYKLLEVLQMFPALFLGSSFSLMTRYVGEKDERIYSAFQKQFDFLALIALPVVVGTFILALPIIKYITGSGGDFATASTINLFGYSMTSVNCLKILIFSVGVNFFTNLYNFMMVSLGKQRKMIWPTIGFATFNILINLYLIPRFTYIGASFSTLLTELVVLVSLHFIVKKSIVLPIRFGDFFKILISALTMGLVTYTVYNYYGGLFTSIFAAIIVYVILVIAFGVIPMDLIKKTLKLSN